MDIIQNLGQARRRPLVYDAVLTASTAVPDGAGGTITDLDGIVLLTDQYGRQGYIGRADFDQKYDVTLEPGQTVQAAPHPADAPAAVQAGAPAVYAATDEAAPAAVQPAPAPVVQQIDGTLTTGEPDDVEPAAAPSWAAEPVSTHVVVEAPDGSTWSGEKQADGTVRLVGPTG